ncbi:hypothetical protein ACFPMF_15605 [Larkinella bovis]|uniref:Uncharacterized protein n=1 Tax=Larkinella bovis TaxID=683041 RepID=A0ABW0IE01_9BACT
MLIHVRFFVYEDSGRHTAHHLQADTNVNSLAGFNYGVPLILAEQTQETKPKSYVIADLPFRKDRSDLLTDTVPVYDIYLAHEEQWKEFKPAYSQLTDPWYGPSL